MKIKTKKLYKSKKTSIITPSQQTNEVKNMQGSKSEFFQKSNKKSKQWDDGTGKKKDNRKFNGGNKKRHNSQENV